MKIIFKLLTIILLIIVSIGCASQKPASGRQGEAAGGEIRHAQASKALEEGRFVIEANEFYLPEDKSPVKSSTGNYISMEGKRGRYQFHPRPLPENTAGQPDHNGRHGGNNAGKAEKERRHAVLHEDDRAGEFPGQEGNNNAVQGHGQMPCTGFERTSGISRGQVHGSGKASGRITAAPPATATAPQRRGRYREPCIRGGICRVRRRVRRS